MTVDEQLLDHARRLRPLVTEQAAETEARTYYSEELHEAFRAAGFYRMLVPRRFGGLEVGLRTYYDVVKEIAEGDVSTGWCLTLGTSHAANVAAIYPVETQQDAFASEFICPAVAAPSGQAVRTADGWSISGTWGYCSGSPYATHYLGQTFGVTETGERAMLLFLVPRAQWQRLDDWGHTLGLRGSGSHSITMQDAEVPARNVLVNRWLVDTDPSANVGYAIHGNPLYAGRTLAIFQLGLATLLVAGVRAALDENERLLHTRNTQRPPIIPRAQDPFYRLWYGRASARVAAAEAALHGLIDRHTALCRRAAEQGIPYTREDDLRLNIVAREAQGLAWQALQDDIFRVAGSSAARSGERIERVFRDAAMDWGHFGNSLRDWTGSELARERLGFGGDAALKPDRAHAGAST